MNAPVQPTGLAAARKEQAAAKKAAKAAHPAGKKSPSAKAPAAKATPSNAETQPRKTPGQSGRAKLRWTVDQQTNEASAGDYRIERSGDKWRLTLNGKVLADGVGRQAAYTMAVNHHRRDATAAANKAAS